MSIINLAIFLGNCTSKTYADGSTVTCTYTPDNLLRRTIYASGKWKENAYDAQRRLCGVVYSSPDMDYELQLDEYGRTTYASYSCLSAADIPGNTMLPDAQHQVIRGGVSSLLQEHSLAIVAVLIGLHNFGKRYR